MKRGGASYRIAVGVALLVVALPQVAPAVGEKPTQPDPLQEVKDFYTDGVVLAKLLVLHVPPGASKKVAKDPEERQKEGEAHERRIRERIDKAASGVAERVEAFGFDHLMSLVGQVVLYDEARTSRPAGRRGGLAATGAKLGGRSASLKVTVEAEKNRMLKLSERGHPPEVGRNASDLIVGRRQHFGQQEVTFGVGGSGQQVVLALTRRGRRRLVQVRTSDGNSLPIRVSPRPTGRRF